MTVTARTHRLGLYLKSKDRQSSRNIEKKSVITNSKQLTQKKSADSYKDNYGDRNWNFVKLVNKVLQKWRNYEKVQSSTFHTISRRKLIEDQNTILELSGRVQELQNEVNCMNDSKDFQDAESVRVEIPALPVDQCLSHLSWWNAKPFFWNAAPQRRAAMHLGLTHGISGNVFVNPDASSSAPYPQELHQWNS